MKITSETTSAEVKERMDKVLQSISDVENNERNVGNILDQAEITREEYEKLSDEEKIQRYLKYSSGRTEQDIPPAAKALADAVQSGELRGPDIIKGWANQDTGLENSEIILNNGKNVVDKYEQELEAMEESASDDKSTNDISIAQAIQKMHEENQQPEMRLYGVNDKYFQSIDELLKYCRQNKVSTQGLTVLDYFRHFGNFNDVIRKISSESSMFYAVPNERGVCWYSDELNHDTEDWEFNHGTIKSLYKPFRDYGVVFEDDIYAKDAERNRGILKYCKENNLFNGGNK